MRLLLECRLDPRQSLTDLVELPGIVRFGLGDEASPAALDQRSGDRCGDHGEEADPGQHQGRAMNRPLPCFGVTSPYPTVVTVCSANHRPLPIVGYS